MLKYYIEKLILSNLKTMTYDLDDKKNPEGLADVYADPTEAEIIKLIKYQKDFSFITDSDKRTIKIVIDFKKNIVYAFSHSAWHSDIIEKLKIKNFIAGYVNYIHETVTLYLDNLDIDYKNIPNLNCLSIFKRFKIIIIFKNEEILRKKI